MQLPLAVLIAVASAAPLAILSMTRDVPIGLPSGVAMPSGNHGKPTGMHSAGHESGHAHFTSSVTGTWVSHSHGHTDGMFMPIATAAASSNAMDRRAERPIGSETFSHPTGAPSGVAKPTGGPAAKGGPSTEGRVDKFERPTGSMAFSHPTGAPSGIAKSTGGAAKGRPSMPVGGHAKPTGAPSPASSTDSSDDSESTPAAEKRQFFHGGGKQQEKPTAADAQPQGKPDLQDGELKGGRPSGVAMPSGAGGMPSGAAGHVKLTGAPGGTSHGKPTGAMSGGEPAPTGGALGAANAASDAPSASSSAPATAASNVPDASSSSDSNDSSD